MTEAGSSEVGESRTEDPILEEEIRQELKKVSEGMRRFGRRWCCRCKKKLVWTDYYTINSDYYCISCGDRKWPHDY